MTSESATIARLERVIDEMQRAGRTYAERRTSDAFRIAALEAALRDAPHGPDCILLEDHKGRPCDCWKSKVVLLDAGKNTAYPTMAWVQQPPNYSNRATMQPGEDATEKPDTATPKPHRDPNCEADVYADDCDCRVPDTAFRRQDVDGVALLNSIEPGAGDDAARIAETGIDAAQEEKLRRADEAGLT